MYRDLSGSVIPPFQSQFLEARYPHAKPVHHSLERPLVNEPTRDVTGQLSDIVGVALAAEAALPTDRTDSENRAPIGCLVPASSTSRIWAFSRWGRTAPVSRPRFWDSRRGGIPSGALVATSAPVIVCLPVLRLKEIYVVLVTFAFTQLFYQMILN
jgi:hypothetical protein